MKSFSISACILPLAFTLGLYSVPQAQLRASPYRLEGVVQSEQFQLPWDGPGAAVFNPALVTETDLFDVSTSLFSSVSGKGSTHVQSGSVRIYEGICAGISWFDKSDYIDGSSAVYTDAVITPMFAYGLRGLAGSGSSLDFGVGYELQRMNAFGAVKSTMSALGLGAHFVTPTLRHNLGRLHAGFAFHNLFNSGVKLPDNNGTYNPDWHGETSLFWGGLADRVDLFTSFAFYGGHDPREGSFGPERHYWKSAGVEVRPIPEVGLKLERTWLGYWTAGTVLRFVIDKVHLGGEMNLSHDKFGDQDEGRGYLWALALNVGM